MVELKFLGLGRKKSKDWRCSLAMFYTKYIVFILFSWLFRICIPNDDVVRRIDLKQSATEMNWITTFLPLRFHALVTVYIYNWILKEILEHLQRTAIWGAIPIFGTPSIFSPPTGAIPPAKKWPSHLSGKILPCKWPMPFLPRQLSLPIFNYQTQQNK